MILMPIWSVLILSFICIQDVFIVLDGMDLVKKIEGEGSGSGKPKKQVTIAKSGELSKKSWVSV